MKKEFVCISCPVGCRLTVWEDEDGAVQVQGNTCPRGKAYGVQEFTAPMRTVTSSVPVQHGERLMCSVKTDAPVPKARIPEVLAAIRRVGVRAPVRVGDRIVENVAGTGANVVATRRVAEKKR